MSRRAGRWLVERTRARLSAFMVGASEREISAERKRRYGMAKARLDVFAALIAVSTLSFSACRPHAAPESESSESANADGGIAANAEAVSAHANVEAGSTLHTCDASGATCASNEYCVFEPRLCGKGKKPGTCRPKPTQCPDTYSPICACDGKIYPNECRARAAGVDLDVTGTCRERVPDWMACGARLCNAHTSYCEIVLSDVFELPTDYTCKPLPKACIPSGDAALPTCACFPAGTRCLSFCGPIETGGLSGFHLTCRL